MGKQYEIKSIYFLLNPSPLPSTSFLSDSDTQYAITEEWEKKKLSAREPASAVSVVKL